MSLPVVLRPLARVDVQLIHAELEARAGGLGDKFLDRLQETLDRIEAMPELNSVRGPGSRGCEAEYSTRHRKGE